MYRHVCTMFSNVRTVLPILVQVVRIPEAGINLMKIVKLRQASGTLRYYDIIVFYDIIVLVYDIIVNIMPMIS